MPASDIDPRIRHARAQLGGYRRRDRPDNDPEVQQARAELEQARAEITVRRFEQVKDVCALPGEDTEAFIARLVASAPTLTNQQVDQLRALLPPVPADDGRVGT